MNTNSLPVFHFFVVFRYCVIPTVDLNIHTTFHSLQIQTIFICRLKKLCSVDSYSIQSIYLSFHLSVPFSCNGNLKLSFLIDEIINHFPSGILYCRYGCGGMCVCLDGEFACDEYLQIHRIYSDSQRYEVDYLSQRKTGYYKNISIQSWVVFLLPLGNNFMSFLFRNFMDGKGWSV